MKLALGDALTLEHLRKCKACREDRERFARHFPEGMKITRENIVLASVLFFPLWWAAEKFLPEEQRRAYLRKAAVIDRQTEEQCRVAEEKGAEKGCWWKVVRLQEEIHKRRRERLGHALADILGVP